jgi:poly-gamma-glutamate capsule biosynthesis protein CapA/YwtB (metallophosphatase superfamily)
VTVRLALAGDTMLGRGVAETLRQVEPESLVADEVAEVIRAADLFVLNLECCISVRGRPWPDPRKPFFFRAPPKAVGLLTHLDASCVTLANNHTLDFGREAFVDTMYHLRQAGITWAGAGMDEGQARGPAFVEARGFRLAVVSVTDHPAAYAARPGRPGVAYADLASGVPDWLEELVAKAGAEADAVLVSPHWGPNMVPEPVPHVRAATHRLMAAGATLVAGHSAHVFHGVSGRVLYDLGDFLDDYATNPMHRNDLGLLFLVTIDEHGPTELEAVPLRLDYCHTRLAEDEDAQWVRDRFHQACRALGSEVRERDGRLVLSLQQAES